MRHSREPLLEWARAQAKHKRAWQLVNLLRSVLACFDPRGVAAGQEESKAQFGARVVLPLLCTTAALLEEDVFASLGGSDATSPLLRQLHAETVKALSKVRARPAARRERPARARDSALSTWLITPLTARLHPPSPGPRARAVPRPCKAGRWRRRCVAIMHPGAALCRFSRFAPHANATRFRRSPVFLGLARFPELRSASLRSHSALLVHPFPKVRRTSAERAYAQLLAHGDAFFGEDEDRADQVLGLLAETAWDQPVRAQRQGLMTAVLTWPSLCPRRWPPCGLFVTSTARRWACLCPRRGLRQRGRPAPRPGASA